MKLFSYSRLDFSAYHSLGNFDDLRKVPYRWPEFFLHITDKKSCVVHSHSAQTSRHFDCEQFGASGGCGWWSYSCFVYDSTKLHQHCFLHRQPNPKISVNICTGKSLKIPKNPVTKDQKAIRNNITPRLVKLDKK